MKGVAARKLAVDILVKVEVEKAFANVALSNAFDKLQKAALSERDRAFTTFLVQGVLRHRDELDTDIKAISREPLAKMTPAVRNLLRVAIFQLKFANDIPQSAVLNTAIEIGKKLGHEGIGRFVTGVLRNYLRKNPDLAEKEPTEHQPQSDDAEAEADDSTSNDPAELARKHSVQEWLVKRWLNIYGVETTKKLLKFSQSVPELTVRTCESGVTVEGLMTVFENNGIKFRQGQLMPSCLIIEDRGKHKGPVEKLPGYKHGLFVVQDEAAAFPATVVAAKPGEVIIDLCAAPGGKSVQMAEDMENKGRVLAVDPNETRLELLKKTRRRVGLTNIEVMVADGTNFVSDTMADKVLLDAPCTGTGVINRRSDLRFQRDEPDVRSLVELQRRLLTNAANMLKPGGVLVYSTCSLEPEENQQNIEWFLSERKDFTLDSLEPFMKGESPKLFAPGELQRGWVQLIPTQHNVSGFFIARLVKNADEQTSTEGATTGAAEVEPADAAEVATGSSTLEPI